MINEITINETSGKAVIYKLISPSGKVYIGQTINFKERLKRYRSNTVSVGKYISNAIKKYGFDSFDISILEMFDLDDEISLTKQKLDHLETHYIDEFKSLGENGYNLTSGGKGSFKREVSIETRRKLSVSNTGKNSVGEIELCCPICNNVFKLKPFEYRSRVKRNKTNKIYCSRGCCYIGQEK